MIVETKYDIGQIVYLITDEEQKARIITGFTIREGGFIVYDLGCGSNDGIWAYECEITDERDEVKRLL